MKKKEIKKKNESDLITELNEKSLKLRDLRFGFAGSKNKNVKEQKTVKKDIARIKTALNNK
jgi:ribosomal protein L29